MSRDVFAEYEALCARVTRESAELFERYAAHLQCRRGCYYCCDDIAVLPIEFEALRRAVSETGIPSGAGSGGPPEDEGLTPGELARRRSHDRTPAGRVENSEADRRRCGFLGREGECTVYAARPVICRAHGLPLAYRLHEYDEHGRGVPGRTYMDSWCDLNFTGLADESAAAYFDRHGRINQARLNETLEELNRRFLSSPDGARYRDRDWIRLSELVGDRR
ncbi:MAG: YkgJ family cysteine cluster protein [Spirochaetia bacterium]